VYVHGGVICRIESDEGSVNVLTSERWTPLAFGNAQHTVMVEVKKVASV